MRKLVLLTRLFAFLSFIVFSESAFAQVGQNKFRYLQPKPLGITFLDVSFADNNNGLAVGNGTSIARTTDGGNTWTYGAVLFTTSSGFKQRPTIQDVHFVNPTTAYAVGDSGMMIKSTDGGRNWTQINNPLYGNARNINAVWFINKDTGYIGGQAHNLNPISADSLNPLCSPKLYFTRNGGNTWDSINAPRGSLSWVGLVQNTVNPPIKVPTNALNKEIYRIQFVNDSVGFVIGSGSGTTSGFPQAYPGTTAGSTTTSTFAANIGSLVWKVNKNVITDYTITKEKIGYSGVAPFGTPPTATNTYNSTTLPSQSLKAMTPISDSVLIVASFNNGCVVRIRTGVNDSTVLSQFNPAALPGALPAVTGSLTGLPTAKGRYEILQYNNAPSTPLAYNQMPLPVLPPYAITNANCVNGKRAPDGKIYFTTNAGRLFTSPDNGTNWSLVQAIPTTTNFSGLQMFALDITANGKLHEMGTNGVYTTSTDGVNWTPNYSTISTAGGQNKMEFADCNNGVIMGNAGLVWATTNGGQTWSDRTIASFGPTVTILGMSFPASNSLYFTATNGNVYFSPDMGTTNNLLLLPGRISNNYGLATWGTGANTRIWVTSFRSSAPLAERMVVYRSLNNGNTWDTIKQFSAMTTAASSNVGQVIKFVSANEGYMCGPKALIYKTTDGGATWNLITPDAPLTTSTLFSGQHALGVFGNKLVYWTLVSTTRYLYTSSDGGATWSANMWPVTIASEPTFNISDFIMHDANNFYALTGPSRLMVTNDGGSSWRIEQAPSGGSFTAGTFVPLTVPAGTPMANRKLLLAGQNHILEYGEATSNVGSTETQIGSCANATNGTLTINASGGILPYTYSLDGGAFQATNVFTGVAAGSHTIAVKDGSCAAAVTKTILMTTRPVPSVNAGPDKTMVAGDNGVMLEGGATNTNPSSIAWTPTTNVTNATSFLATAKPANTTTYTLTVTDANGCIGTDNMVVTVLPYCLKVMDAFTPNGDGQNDRWIVTNNGGQCVEQVFVTVHNRYGNVVYKNDNYQNNWDGTYNGKPVPDGTYYYVVKYTLINGNAASFKGDVTILR